MPPNERTPSSKQLNPSKSGRTLGQAPRTSSTIEDAASGTAKLTPAPITHTKAPAEPILQHQAGYHAAGTSSSESPAHPQLAIRPKPKKTPSPVPFWPAGPTLLPRGIAANGPVIVPRGIPGRPLQPNRRSQNGQKSLTRAGGAQPPSGRMLPTGPSTTASKRGSPAAANIRSSRSSKSILDTGTNSTTLSKSPSGRTLTRKPSNKAVDVFNREVKNRLPQPGLASKASARTAAVSSATAIGGAAARAAPTTASKRGAGLTVVQSKGFVKQKEQQERKHQQQLSRCSSLSSISNSDSDDESVMPAAALYEQARVRLGLEAGLCIAEELLKGHSRTLQSNLTDPATSPATADKLNSSIFQDLHNTTRNPLFSEGNRPNAGTSTGAAANNTITAAATASCHTEAAGEDQAGPLLDNPMFKGRSVLQWLARQSASGMFTTCDSACSTNAPIMLQPSGTGSVTGSKVQALLPAYYRVQQQLLWQQHQQMGSAPQHPLTVDPRAQSTLSVDSAQLSMLVKERVSTDQLTITTDIAPDTSRFTSSRNSRRPGSAGSGLGTTAIYAPGSALKQAAGDTLNEVEIEYSQDGQMGDDALIGTASRPATAGVGADGRQTGEIIYEMIPVVAENILSWSGVEGLARMSSFGTIGTLGTLNDTYRSGAFMNTADAAAVAGLGGDGDSAHSTMRNRSGKQEAWQPRQMLAAKQLVGVRWPTLDEHGSTNTSMMGAMTDEDKLARLASAEHKLREHGLLEKYLSSTSAALLGTQAALIRAISLSPINSSAGQAPAGKRQPVSVAAAAAAASSGPGGRELSRVESKVDRRQLVRDISRRMRKEVWLPPPKHDPLPLVWSPIGVITAIAYLAAVVYYFYVRIAYSLDMGRTNWYGVVVFACEVIGFTSVVPYGMMLLRRCEHRGQGLPEDDGKWKLPRSKRFSVRVLVPCYKEDLETIKETVNAALTADLPPSCSRVVYLCDDGKDKAKAEYIAKLGDAAVYVSGRVRKPGEINGKAANLNNCLKNVIYADYLTEDNSIAEDHQPIPVQEVVVVFDADMVCNKDFFRKVLEVMWDESVGLCLTPQSFSNIPQACDVWNHINVQFWEYILPGCDALGYVGCTGTNFCIRATALNKVGWFPEYTITEDYALSMELKLAGVKGRYLPKYLAVGEAPEDIRSVLQQRSRWCKGHMQVFFSRRCPLFHPKLNMLHRILYTNGTWAYFATVITTFIYTIVPFVSLVWGIHPVSLSSRFTLAATLNFAAGALVNFQARRFSHFQGLWLSLISNHLLAWTYFKAIINTLLSLAGLKKKTGFKATNKTGAALNAAGNMLLSTMRAISQMSITVGQRMAAVYYKNRPGGLADGPGAAVTAGGVITVGPSPHPADLAAAAAACNGEQGIVHQLPQYGAEQIRSSAGLDRPVAEAVEDESSDDEADEPAEAAATVIAATGAANTAMQLANLPTTQSTESAVQAADITAVVAVKSPSKSGEKGKKKLQNCWPRKAATPKAPKPPKPEDDEPHWYDWMLENAEGLGWNAKGSKTDAWVMLLSLAISVTAVAAGLYQIAARGERYDLGTVTKLSAVFSTGQLHEFMLLALLLGGINAISPLLFFIYFCNKGRLLKVSTYLGQTLNAGLFVGAVTVLWLLTPMEHNLPSALRLSTSFITAQRAISPAEFNSTMSSGGGTTLLAWQQIPQGQLDKYPWLAAAPTGSVNDLVAGGFYMAGDYVKHTFPLATDMAMLAWSLRAFEHGYRKAGVYDDLLRNLQVGARYLLDCHVAPDLYVARVGNPDDYQVDTTTGTGFWGLPSHMPPNRTSLVINTSSPSAAGAEVLAAASAALSATAVLFEPIDQAFHAAALDEAKLLLDLAEAMQPRANVTLDQPLGVAVGGASAKGKTVGVTRFPSSSVMDDMAFAAAWMVQASGEWSWLDKAHEYLNSYWDTEAPWATAEAYWPSYDNMAWAAAVLLLQQPVMSNTAADDVAWRHREALSIFFKGWLNGRNNWTDVTVPTPAGFPWVSDTPLPTAAATSLLGLLWASGSDEADSSLSDAGKLSDAVKHRLNCFALHQATYILGRSRGGWSFLVGYGRKYPGQPQHRLASCWGLAGGDCSVDTGLMSNNPNPVMLQGALVSGPAVDDSYSDTRSNSLQSSVGLHHNIPFIGLLGGLITSGVTQGQCSAGEGLYQMLTVNDIP